MICMQLSPFRKILGLLAWVGGIVTLSPVWSVEGTSENHANKSIVNNILGISGWYERYANGQLVLYPVVNLPLTMTGMYGMMGMGGMYGMTGMTSMYGMSSMYGMVGMYNTGKLGLPVNRLNMGNVYGMAGMSDMPGMAGMNNMQGMISMSNMTGMSGMSGMGGFDVLSGSYQMTFGRFWITREGNLILYPVTATFGVSEKGTSDPTNVESSKDN